MATNPLVTVLIPAYNAARYLAESIESILLQTWPNLECVVLDGGSQDATADIARAYAAQDPRVRVEVFPDTHPCSRIDSIIPKLSSHYVAIQHADDISYGMRIARQVQAFQEDPELGVSSGLCRSFFHDRMQAPRAEGLSIQARPEQHEHIKASLPFWWVMHCPTFMYDREKAIANGLKFENEYTLCNDYWQTITHIEKLKYGNIQEELSAYRMHWDSDGPRHRSQLEEESRKLKRATLEHFGIEFTERQLEIHSNLRLIPEGTVGATTPEGYDEAIAWLFEIHAQNERKNIFDKPFFTTFLQAMINRTLELKAQTFK